MQAGVDRQPAGPPADQPFWHGGPPMTTPGSAQARALHWWPKGVKRTDHEPPELSFARAAVLRRTDLRDSRDAGQLLATCYRFARWLVARGESLDVGSAFDAERVSTYVVEELATRPRGTQDATRSRLRRLGRNSPTARGGNAAEPCPPAPAAPPEGAPGSDVHAALEAYVPTRVNPVRFARVSTVVRDVARRCEPATVARAQAFVRCGAYLAAWVDELGRPLRPDVVFHPDTVEDFVATLADMLPAGSAATVASVLRTMASAVLPKLAAGGRTRIGRRTDLNPPYSATEQATLLDRAAKLPNRKRRRHVSALLVLGIGAGAFPGEAAGVRPADITPTEDGARVVLGDGDDTRVVTVPAPYGALLVQLAAEASGAGDTWLVGGGPSRRNRANYLYSDLSAAWGIEVNSFRLRATFLLSLASRPHTLVELLDASGLKGLDAFEDLLPHLRAAAQHHRALTLVLGADRTADDVEPPTETDLEQAS